MVLLTGKHNLTWSLLHLKTRTYNPISVCPPQWHNLTICGQWKLRTRRSHKWAVKHKYRQADLKGMLGPSQAWSLNTLKCLLSAIGYIYSVLIVFTTMYQCPHNGIQAAKSCIHACKSLTIKWTITADGLWYRPMDETCDNMLSCVYTS